LHDTVWQEQAEYLIKLKRNSNGTDNNSNTYQKKELMALAHKKGLLLNEYLNIILLNKIL
jgi:hypothetical protein